jgi:hypothetical protein
MAVKKFTREELLAMVDTNVESERRRIDSIFQGWFARGDGCAVYENMDIGSPNAGHRKFTSFGSPAAQLEVDEPPLRLPDIGGQINWAYQLIGEVR